MIDYWTSTFHRGYTICRKTERTRRSFAAFKDSNSWWEGETPEEVEALIDAAMDEEEAA